MDSDTPTNKMTVEDEKDDVNKYESEYQFLDRSIDGIDLPGSNSREITLEFLNSSNGDKYDRLVRDVKIKTPFKRILSQDSRANSPILFSQLENENASEEAELASPTTTNSGRATFFFQATRRSNSKRPCNVPFETNSEILARRQKQIDYGKNTIGYDNYIKQVPVNSRNLDHPWTPPKHYKRSRRSFDGLIKKWRTQLHCFDPPGSKATK